MTINNFSFFTLEECSQIKEYAYEKEIELKEKPRDLLNCDPTTNFHRYNFFKDHPIYADRLVNFLNITNAPLQWPIILQSWVNIYRKGDGIAWHRHKGDNLSFNIFIDGDSSHGLTYIRAGRDGGLDEYDCKVENLENKKGHIQIFDSAMYHKIDPVSSERITVGGTITCQNILSLDLLAMNHKEENGIIILEKQ
tara:strand:- start:477 stop:1061 length:585 start_codon:yes stop_codon:yes gene_type:complete